jgi:transcriptional regulator
MLQINMLLRVSNPSKSATFDRLHPIRTHDVLVARSRETEIQALRFNGFDLPFRLMYKGAFGIDDHLAVLGAVRAVGVGHLVTASDSGGPESTTLPFVVDDSMSILRAHFARANPHWRQVDGLSALMIVPGPDAYISPNWYLSKVEHQRVVPTSNYELVHIRGVVTIHDDPEWKLRLVRDLTDHHERLVDDPDSPRAWSVDDAPRDFIDKQLAAIVGVEIAITSAELKLKMSQNKPDPDRQGAASGLRRSTHSVDLSVAELMDPDEG